MSKHRIKRRRLDNKSASNFQVDYDYSCKDKKQYTERVANSTAAEIIRQYQDAVYAYKCRYCYGWHIGHIQQPATEEELFSIVL